MPLTLNRDGASGDEKAERRERGILLGSGLVGGEGLFGVLIAAAVYWQIRFGDTSEGVRLPGQMDAVGGPVLANIAALLVFSCLAAYWARRIRRSK